MRSWSLESDFCWIPLFRVEFIIVSERAVQKSPLECQSSWNLLFHISVPSEALITFIFSQYRLCMITFIIGFPLTRTLNLTVNVPPSTASSLALGRESSGSRMNSSTSSVLARSGSMAHTEVGRAGLDGVSPKEALRPDKGQMKNNPFGVTPGQLNKLLNPKSLAKYKALGGLSKIARYLRADLAAGLSADKTRLEGTVYLQDVTKNESIGI